MASITITAINEPHLEKTIDSILKTDYDDIEEILIIDDHSDIPVNIDKPKVKIIRNDKQEGLIRSRNIAAEAASSDIVVSIDAHCDVQPGWVPKLAEPIYNDYKCLTAPAVCGLDPNKWQRIGSTGEKVSWKWNLDIRWSGHGEITPAIAGCCFAFSKKWWYESGGLDNAMNIWGGENIEFSLKTWLCGGSVKVVSTIISHYFKPTWIGYKMDTKTLLHNKARIAEVWLDGYKDQFYKAIGHDTIDYGDISDRLRYKALQKRSIRWFIENLQPELRVK